MAVSEFSVRLFLFWRRHRLLLFFITVLVMAGFVLAFRQVSNKPPAVVVPGIDEEPETPPVEYSDYTAKIREQKCLQPMNISMKDLKSADISAVDQRYWQQVVRRNKLVQKIISDKKTFQMYDTRAYAFELFEPYYPCLTKQKVGGVGIDGHWICDVDGLKPTCPYETDKSKCRCIVYYFGDAEDITRLQTEVQLHSSYGCAIHVFDPLIGKLKTKQGLVNGGGVFYHPWTLSDETAQVKIKNFMTGTKTIEDTMEELDHARVDLIRIDINNAVLESKALTNIAETLPFGLKEIIVELRFKRLDLLICSMNALEQAGFRVFAKDHNPLYGGNAVEFALVKQPLLPGNRPMEEQ